MSARRAPAMATTNRANVDWSKKKLADKRRLATLYQRLNGVPYLRHARQMIVARVLSGSSADRAGVRAGDRVASVDGQAGGGTLLSKLHSGRGRRTAPSKVTVVRKGASKPL